MKLLTLVLLILFFIPTGDISMVGIKINDPKKSLDKLQLEIVAK